MSNRTYFERGKSQDELEADLRHDQTLVGTPDYQGIAYFWNYGYRHYLRDASYGKCRRVHDAFLRAGLPLDGESPEHLAIIRRITGTY